MEGRYGEADNGKCVSNIICMWTNMLSMEEDNGKDMRRDMYVYE
jgi:hypothetical protein